MQEFGGNSVDRHEDDQPPAKLLRPAAEIGENAEDGEKAHMDSEFAPREDGGGKPNKLVGVWHKEQDGEGDPVGNAKDDDDSHGDGSGVFSGLFVRNPPTNSDEEAQKRANIFIPEDIPDMTI